MNCNGEVSFSNVGRSRIISDFSRLPLSPHANGMIERYFESRRFLFTLFLILIHCSSSIRRYTVILRASLYKRKI